MPVLTTSGPPAVTDLASRLVADLNDGRVARQAIAGDRSTAFGWTTGLPFIAARLVSSAVVDGLSFNATRVAPSATPAAKVAEGGAKPSAITVTSGPVALSKYAGLGSISTEQALDTDALIPALVAVIGTSCVLAFDADFVAALAADAGADAAGDTWPEAILSGVAAVAANGGSPSVLVLSAADYAAAVGSPGVGYAQNPADGAVALFGQRIALSPGLSSGTGYVLDPAAVMAVEFAGSPFAVIDPYSGLDTNAIRVSTEWFAAAYVTAPGGVCEITGPTAPATRTASGGGSKVTKAPRRSDYELGA